MIRTRTAADTALLLEATDLDESMRLLPALQAASIEGVVELVPAARSIMVRFDPALVDAATLRARLLAVAPAASRPMSTGAVTIPVHYDGEDLSQVADELGVSIAELVARHQAATWRVAFTGFAPGFGYLVGDDPVFEVPRRRSPRTRIPAGSVALAGRYCGVYPAQSPGGWQLIGRTDARMWDLDREPPALLAPGTSVRFAGVQGSPERSSSVAAAHQRPSLGSAAHEPRPPLESTNAVEILRPGLQLLVQDLGRPGMGALGVGVSGTADRGALREANRAVGNAPGEAALELAGGGASLRFRGDAVVALSGALVDASVRSRTHTRVVDAGRAAAIEDGDELRIGPAQDGLRVLIAIRGGIGLEPTLGSLATDTLARLGPAPLAAGDALPLRGSAAAPAAVERTRAPRIPLPRAGETVQVEIVLGPRQDWFTEAANAALLEQDWEVTPRSDRVGIRLAGARPLERARRDELESEGAVTGAIQVPPDGQPVLFLPDHPLTGGYPVIGAVVDHHLDLIGQLPPGARIRFRAHTP